MATILVVDDEAPIVDMLGYVLDDEGYTVYGAYSGHEGLRLALHLQPDLLVSDVVMPDLPGDRLCQTLQQQGWQKPIILMSANHTTVDPARCRPTAFLSKPFQLATLLRTIKQAFSDGSVLQ